MQYLRASFFLLLFGLLLSAQAQAQKYLVLDRYTTKRIKLMEGDQIWLKLKNSEFKIRDQIKQLKDTSLLLKNRNHEVALKDIESLYFTRSGWKFMTANMGYVGGGFGFSALVHPLISNARYNRREAAILGASALAISQISRLFHRKRYRITPNTRIRILDLSFQQMQAAEE